MSRSQHNRNAMIETLEGRTLLAAQPLSIDINGSELVITGTNKADAITITQNGSELTIANKDWSTTVTNTFSSIRVNGSKGNDKVTIDASVTTNTKLFGGAGKDTLIGGSGEDVFVTVGGGKDFVYGADGNDSFWVDKKDVIGDASSAEIAGGNVHRIAAFQGIKTQVQKGKKIVTKTTKVGLEPKGENLADPKVTEAGITYKNFYGSKLFADNGPVADDVNQGYVGDCYFLATLASVADTNPNTIKQSVVDLGDGTFAVRFFKGAQEVYFRVDGDLPTWSNGQLAYAGKGAEGSIWVAIMEKAFTQFRTGANTYESIEAGWMSEAYAAIGKTSQNYFSQISATTLLNTIKAALDAGKSVTYACYDPTDGAPLIGYHAYTVVSVDAAAKTITLRNPWGIDGAGWDGCNDGYVTVTAQQAHNAFMGMMTAWV